MGTHGQTEEKQPAPVTAFDKTEIIAGLNKSMSSNPVYAGQFVNISSQASAPFPVSVLA